MTMTTKKETYAQAKARLLNDLSEKGWTVKSDLKFPHATSPSGKTRLWFNPQAVHITRTGDLGRHEMKHGLSLWCDIRELNVNELLRWAAF